MHCPRCTAFLWSCRRSSCFWHIGYRSLVPALSPSIVQKHQELRCWSRLTRRWSQRGWALSVCRGCPGFLVFLGRVAQLLSVRCHYAHHKTMSLELHIFMQDSRVPSREAWQQAIEQLAFPTVLYPTLDVRMDTGFSPTSYKGQAIGFEFSLEPAADILSSYSHITPSVGSRDKC